MDITVSDLDIMTSAINYRKWLYGQVAPFVGKRVLEIGAGVGNYTDFLLERDLVVCVEIHEDAASRLRNRFASNSNIEVFQGDITHNSFLSLADRRMDTALCFNVLEHIPNDIQALSNVRKILKPGGRMLLIVPAIPAIMGTVDHSLGHCRRYTSKSLKAAFKAAGYHVEHLWYINMVGIVGWWLNNRLLKRTEESHSQIVFYDRVVVPWVSRIERLIPPPVGLSLVCVAKSTFS